MTTINANELELNGVRYVRAGSVPTPVPSGNRCVLVLDRGWIVAGDITDRDGRIIVDNAVHVRSWSGIGFDGLIDSDGRGDNVDVRKMSSRFDCPADTELFRVPVGATWGR